MTFPQSPPSIKNIPPPTLFLSRLLSAGPLPLLPRDLSVALRVIAQSGRDMADKHGIVVQDDAAAARCVCLGVCECACMCKDRVRVHQYGLGLLIVCVRFCCF